MPSEVRSYLEVVARNSDRLLRLVEDLLFIARLQAGKLVLETNAVDLAELARLAVEESTPRAEQNSGSSFPRTPP